MIDRKPEKRKKIEDLILPITEEGGEPPTLKLKMPTKDILHKSFKMRNYAKKQVILDNLYQNNDVM